VSFPRDVGIGCECRWRHLRRTCSFHPMARSPFHHPSTNCSTHLTCTLAAAFPANLYASSCSFCNLSVPFRCGLRRQVSPEVLQSAGMAVGQQLFSTGVIGFATVDFAAHPVCCCAVWPCGTCCKWGDAMPWIACTVPCRWIHCPDCCRPGCWADQFSLHGAVVRFHGTGRDRPTIRPLLRQHPVNRASSLCCRPYVITPFCARSLVSCVIVHALRCVPQ
jgi:hypothetical protein